MHATRGRQHRPRVPLLAESWPRYRHRTTFAVIYYECLDPLCRPHTAGIVLV